jgi:hypothetical protein
VVAFVKGLSYKPGMVNTKLWFNESTIFWVMMLYSPLKVK